MNWRVRGLDLRVGHWALQCCNSVDGRDRWLLIYRNSITRAWSAPRWLSWTKGDGRLRGG